MAAKIKFKAGRCAYRNTWKNEHGHIVTRLYDSAEKAELVAKNIHLSNHCMFQEIGTPVYQQECLMVPGGSL